MARQECRISAMCSLRYNALCSVDSCPKISFSLLQARLRVPETVLREIESLNSLDVQLFKHAQYIFANEHKHMVQKVVYSVTAPL